MTISPIKTLENNTQINKTVELISISKKYPLSKIDNKDINTSFEEFWALRDVSLDIYQGQVLGIIGRNGAGKTTLLNIIAGVLSPSKGEALAKGRILGLFNLGVGFQDELTGRENIFLNGAIIGATKKELESKLSSIIDFSELGNFIDVPLGAYSQGMRLRLAFSIIANLDFDILVIDEVLAVGDALFQNKCFQQLMDFRRAGKTLIITTQDMALIERFCDKVALLDHGCLLHYGDTPGGVNKYHAILNTEKFFVGPAQKNINLVENTKKWADDVSGWDKKLGTKEVVIDSVYLINKFGVKTNQIRSRESLTIKVHFTARNNVKEPHFGVAIFRNDGVYCYGPNTLFDNKKISELGPGRGWFALEYKELLFAPGEYKISVAIWDKNERVAFDYHNGFYKLIIKGPNSTSELLDMPFKFYPRNFVNFRRTNMDIALDTLIEQWGKKIDTEGTIIESVKLLNHLDEGKKVFKTNEPVKLAIDLISLKHCGKNSYLWVGIYRDDGIYCQGITQALGRNKNFKVVFPKLPLLPGSYRICLGIWDSLASKFIICHHTIYPFRMVFNRQDHGTIYLEHEWKWR